MPILGLISEGHTAPQLVCISSPGFEIVIKTSTQSTQEIKITQGIINQLIIKIE